MWDRQPGMYSKSSGDLEMLCAEMTSPTDAGFPGGSPAKESASDAGDPSSIPGLGRSPREGNGNPLQYTCLEISMDRGAWRASVHVAAQSDTTQQLTLASVSTIPTVSGTS